MTSLFPPGKTPQAVALAFAVASLQNPQTVGGLDAFSHIPQSLLEAAAIAAASSVSNAIGVENSEKGACSSVKNLRAELRETPVDTEGDADENGKEDDGDNERRLARSRERNREHARKTRLRKKAQLEALQSKVRGLEAERQVLKQKVEECGIATILLGLSAGEKQDEATTNLLGSAEATAAATDSTCKTSEFATSQEDSEDEFPTGRVHSTSTTDSMVAALSGAKRKRFISEAIGEQPNQQHLTINVNGQVTVIGAGKSHINWKTGVYRDQQGVQRQLTSEQLEDLRRERNRLHAKMTRSRKKCFVATIEKAIQELEAENSRMREILEKVGSSSLSTSSATLAVGPAAPTLQPRDAIKSIITPATSPALAPAPGPLVPASSINNYVSKESPVKKPKLAPAASHGFRLDG